MIKIMDDFHRVLGPTEHPKRKYLAMFSTWFGQVVKDPRLMLVPVDDHMVHRGDGVFEAFKSVARRIYLLDEHLKRLERSAQFIGLKLPFSLENIKTKIFEVARAAEREDLLFRLYVSRGPGSFSADPYDTLGSQLYIIASEIKSPPAIKGGVRALRSSVAVKDPWYAQIKSCNYLPNVLMKKEAVERGADLAIGFDGEGLLTEGPTENLVLLSRDQELWHPPLNRILWGTTMLRLMELAKEKLGMSVVEKPASYSDVFSAKALFVVGTTWDVVLVRSLDGREVGRVSEREEWASKLDALIKNDQRIQGALF